MDLRHLRIESVSYEKYREARQLALETSLTALDFLEDMVRREPWCYSPAFRILWSLIVHTREELSSPYFARDCFVQLCSVLRYNAYAFHVLLYQELIRIERPFYYYVEALSGRDRRIRELFAQVNGMACCGSSISVRMPRDQRDLYEQLNALREDEQPARPSTILPASTDPVCASCWEVIAASDFVEGKITEQCEHEANICRDCLSSAIAAQLDDRLWNQLKCPLCPAKLDASTVERFGTAAFVARYQKFMVMDTMKNVPNFRSCLRPSCPSGHIHAEGDAEPLMVCGACGYKMCYPHSLPWHEGQTCAQYDDMRRHRADDDASLALIARLTKPCPGERCGVPIQKNLGCDHMTCFSCGHEFCWQCLQPYEPIRHYGNAGHATTCRYHSANLPAMALLNPLAYFPDG